MKAFTVLALSVAAGFAAADGACPAEKPVGLCCYQVEGDATGKCNQPMEGLTSAEMASVCASIANSSAHCCASASNTPKGYSGTGCQAFVPAVEETLENAACSAEQPHGLCCHVVQNNPDGSISTGSCSSPAEGQTLEQLTATCSSITSSTAVCCESTSLYPRGYGGSNCKVVEAAAEEAEETPAFPENAACSAEQPVGLCCNIVQNNPDGSISTGTCTTPLAGATPAELPTTCAAQTGSKPVCCKSASNTPKGFSGTECKVIEAAAEEVPAVSNPACPTEKPVGLCCHVVEGDATGSCSTPLENKSVDEVRDTCAAIEGSTAVCCESASLYAKGYGGTGCQAFQPEAESSDETPEPSYY